MRVSEARSQALLIKGEKAKAFLKQLDDLKQQPDTQLPEDLRIDLFLIVYDSSTEASPAALAERDVIRYTYSLDVHKKLMQRIAARKESVRHEKPAPAAISHPIETPKPILESKTSEPLNPVTVESLPEKTQAVVLESACAEGNFETVKTVIASKSSSQDELNKSLHAAVKCAHPDVVAYLLENGAQPSLTSTGKNLMHTLGEAVQGDFVMAIFDMLQQKFPRMIHEVDNDNCTPLVSMLRKKPNPQLVKKFLIAGSSFYPESPARSTTSAADSKVVQLPSVMDIVPSDDKESISPARMLSAILLLLFHDKKKKQIFTIEARASLERLLWAQLSQKTPEWQSEFLAGLSHDACALVLRLISEFARQLTSNTNDLTLSALWRPRIKRHQEEIAATDEIRFRNELRAFLHAQEKWAKKDVAQVALHQLTVCRSDRRLALVQWILSNRSDHRQALVQLILSNSENGINEDTHEFLADICKQQQLTFKEDFSADYQRLIAAIKSSISFTQSQAFAALMAGLEFDAVTSKDPLGLALCSVASLFRIANSDYAYQLRANWLYHYFVLEYGSSRYKDLIKMHEGLERAIRVGSVSTIGLMIDRFKEANIPVLLGSWLSNLLPENPDLSENIQSCLPYAVIPFSHTLDEKWVQKEVAERTKDLPLRIERKPVGMPAKVRTLTEEAASFQLLAKNHATSLKYVLRDGAVANRMEAKENSPLEKLWNACQDNAAKYPYESACALIALSNIVRPNQSIEVAIFEAVVGCSVALKDEIFFPLFCQLLKIPAETRFLLKTSEDVLTAFRYSQPVVLTQFADMIKAFEVSQRLYNATLVFTNPQNVDVSVTGFNKDEHRNAEKMRHLFQSKLADFLLLPVQKNSLALALIYVEFSDLTNCKPDPELGAYMGSNQTANELIKAICKEEKLTFEVGKDIAAEHQALIASIKSRIYRENSRAYGELQASLLQDKMKNEKLFADSLLAQMNDFDWPQNYVHRQRANMLFDWFLCDSFSELFTQTRAALENAVQVGNPSTVALMIEKFKETDIAGMLYEVLFNILKNTKNISDVLPFLSLVRIPFQPPVHAIDEKLIQEEMAQRQRALPLEYKKKVKDVNGEPAVEIVTLTQIVRDFQVRAEKGVARIRSVLKTNAVSKRQEEKQSSPLEKLWNACQDNAAKYPEESARVFVILCNLARLDASMSWSMVSAVAGSAMTIKDKVFFPLFCELLQIPKETQALLKTPEDVLKAFRYSQPVFMQRFAPMLAAFRAIPATTLFNMAAEAYTRPGEQVRVSVGGHFGSTARSSVAAGANVAPGVEYRR